MSRQEPVQVQVQPRVQPQQQSLTIKNIMPALMEWGKIKIGRKGKLVRNTFRQPEKLDHFVVTTMEKDSSDNFIIDDEIMGMIKEKQMIGVEKITEIPIILLYNDIELNFQCRYVCYHGTKKWCSGDGESAMRLTDRGEYEYMSCPCERRLPTYMGEDGKGKGKCKSAGCLSCLIQGAEIVGGAWKFRTTGIHSIQSLIASLLLIKNQTGGLLAGIPLSMVLRPKKASDPITGKQVTIYIVTIIYRGSPQSLQEVAFKIATTETTGRLKIENVEADVRKMLTTTADIDEEVIGESELDHAEEFHPEDAAGDAVDEEKKGKSEIEPKVEPPKPKRKRSRKVKPEEKVEQDSPTDAEPVLTIDPPENVSTGTGEEPVTFGDTEEDDGFFFS